MLSTYGDAARHPLAVDSSRFFDGFWHLTLLTVLTPCQLPPGSILARPTSFFDTGSPNSVLILARPTPFRYWLAQLRFDTAILHVFDRPHPAEGGGELRQLAGKGGETPETPETPTKRRTGVSQACLRPVPAITRQPA